MKMKLKEFSWNLGHVKMIVEDENGQTQTVEGPLLAFSEFKLHLNDRGEYTVSWAYRMERA
jgi:hypothetical protein